MKNNKVFQVMEYGNFSCDVEHLDYIPLDRHVFNTLENFLLEDNRTFLNFLSLSIRKGVGKVITAKNYVGIIKINDGTIIEVLPKVDGSFSASKKLLLNMLSSLTDIPFKNMQAANVDIERMDIFEIFIRAYLDKVFSIVKKGLAGGYERKEGNEVFFKGKLIVSSHIKNNQSHKERSYVEYDEFNTNIWENRLIKKTLEYLFWQSTSSKNKTDIKILLNSFLNVDDIVCVEEKVFHTSKDRNMRDYNDVVSMSLIFLKGKSFTSFHGSNISLALLFPMERLFESYVAQELSKIIRKNSSWTIKIQDSSYYLFNEPGSKFAIRPDIVIKNNITKEVIVFDTKWKILSSQKNNLGIAQDDMYQMYVYQKKYSAKKVVLIYPECEKQSTKERLEYKSSDGVIVDIFFVSLLKIDESLEKWLKDAGIIES